MSGGVAYVLDQHGDFDQCCNLDMVDVEPLSDEAIGIIVRELVEAACRNARRAPMRARDPRVEPLRDSLREGDAARLQRVLKAEAQRARRDIREPNSPSSSGALSETWVIPQGSSKLHREEGRRAPSRRRSASTTGRRSIFRIPEDELQAQGARCMDCGIPVLPSGLPAGQYHPRLERSGLSRPMERPAIERLHATNNFPEFTGRSVPCAVRRLVRARHQRRSGHDQIDRSHRSSSAAFDEGMGARRSHR